MYTGVIYRATSPSHKKYYGQTFHEFQNRKHRHFLEATKRNCQYSFHRAIRKYGFDNFIWEIVEQFAFDDENQLINILNEREIFWIESDSTYLPEFGYNMKIGGFNGRHTAITKEKIKTTLTGIKHSDERKKNISEAHKGQIAWNAGKVCISLSGENNGMHGKSVYDLWVEKYGVDEADIRKENRRIKLSASLKGKNTKKI